MEPETQATSRQHFIETHSLAPAILLRRLAWAGLAVLMLLGSATALQAPVRIMPLGDSLTTNLEGNASYRYWLWKFLTAAHFNVDFVGTQSSDFYKPFDQDMEGHAGFGSAELAAGVSGWAAQTQPQIVLLLIGANDIQEGFSINSALTNVRKIINRLRLVNPNVKILLGLEPPLAGYNSRVRAYNSGLTGVARQVTQSRSPVIVVDLYSGYSAQADTLDGTHPNVYGDYIIASRWYAKLVPVLAQFGQRPR